VITHLKIDKTSKIRYNISISQNFMIATKFKITFAIFLDFQELRLIMGKILKIKLLDAITTNA
jgi:hypothetical protein